MGQAYPSVDTESEEMGLFKENMEAIGSGDNVGTGSLGGWLTGRVLQKVIETLGEGNVTRASILDFLQTQTVEGVELRPTSSPGNAPQSVPGMTSVADPISNVYQVEGGELHRRARLGGVPAVTTTEDIAARRAIDVVKRPLEHVGAPSYSTTSISSSTQRPRPR